MKAFLLLCCALCISLNVNTVKAEENEPTVTYSEPKITSGHSRCQVSSVANGSQIAITFSRANAASQGSNRDSLNCRIELDATMQLTQGWYFHSVQQTVNGGIVKSPNSKAEIAIRATFQQKPVLQFRETKSNVLISRSQQIPVNFAWSKAQQCSGKLQRATGKIVLTFDAQTQRDAQASLNTFDVVLIPARCNS